MTAQLSETVFWKRAARTILAVEGEGLFNLGQYHIPLGFHSGCVAGTVSRYTVRQGRLYVAKTSAVLDDIYGARVQNQRLWEIGPTVATVEHNFFHSLFHFQPGKMPVDFTGRLVVGDNLVPDKREVSVLIHAMTAVTTLPWTYVEIISFQNGRVTGSVDVSERVKRVRDIYPTLENEPRDKMDQADLLLRAVFEETLNFNCDFRRREHYGYPPSSISCKNMEKVLISYGFKKQKRPRGEDWVSYCLTGTKLDISVWIGPEHGNDLVSPKDLSEIRAVLVGMELATISELDAIIAQYARKG
jgi:hypothetical protein